MENFLGIKEESTEPNTIVLKTNRAIGDIFSLKVGAKEGEKIGIKGASYNEQDQLIFTDTEVTLYGKITKVDCSSNKLTSIVITNQPQLREIYCDDNELTKLEVNYVPVLATLYCGNNKDLADIDLKSMPALADLSCYSNSIKQLDLSQNPKLTSLICRDNLIEGTLDLSKNPKVEQVNCYNNKISEIKLAAESSLRHIEMQRNNIKGESMTEFMKALPVYVAYGTDEWDDYGGLNLQGLYVTETSATIEEILRTIKQLNISIETQATSVAQSSSSVEEMVANIASIGQTLGKTDDVIRTLTAATDDGKSTLVTSNTVTQKIAEESGSLMDASSVIQHIASQTNLLAMNAAIEAAHAGEAGKGFAVVADEIRKLAEDSAVQGKTITSTLKTLSGEIETLSASSKTVEEKFNVIFNLAEQVKEMSARLTEAMREQEHGSKEVLTAIKSINMVTTEVQAGSEEMLKGGEGVAEEMRKLDDLTRIITESMNEMASGAVQINNAVQEISEISQKNKVSIENLSNEVKKFKV